MSRPEAKLKTRKKWLAGHKHYKDTDSMLVEWYDKHGKRVMTQSKKRDSTVSTKVFPGFQRLHDRSNADKDLVRYLITINLPTKLQIGTHGKNKDKLICVHCHCPVSNDTLQTCQKHFSLGNQRCSTGHYTSLVTLKKDHEAKKTQTTLLSQSGISVTTQEKLAQQKASIRSQKREMREDLVACCLKGNVSPEQLSYFENFF